MSNWKRGRGATAVVANGMLVAALAASCAFASSVLAKSRAGDLDDSFGGNGLVQTRPDGHNGVAHAVAIGRHHRIVVAGSSGDGFGVVRYTARGRLDTSLAGDGMRSTSFSTGKAVARGVDIGKKGVIVAAGSTCRRDRTGCEFAIARYTSKGRLDRSFGGDGRVELRFGKAFNQASSVAFGGHGKVLVGGSTCAGLFTGCDFALAKLRASGKLDRSFGNSGTGMVVTHFPDAVKSSAYANSMGIDSRRRIVLGGTNRNRSTVLARYTRSGSLDQSFGEGGRVAQKLDRFGGANAVAIDGKDGIVAVGDDRHSPPKWALARFGRGGRLDPKFGTDGQVVTGMGRFRGLTAYGVAIDSRKRIVVAGGHHFALARYQTDGHLDRSFGDDGKVFRDFGSDAFGVAIDSGDRPVLGGHAKHRYAVARFLG
jgi:uncharacterized delta-60 repeat protein